MIGALSNGEARYFHVGLVGDFRYGIPTQQRPSDRRRESARCTRWGRRLPRARRSAPSA